MNATTKLALINTLASSTDGVLMDTLDVKATDIADAVKNNICTVTWTPDGNIVRLSKAGYAAIPDGKSITPTQKAVLEAVNAAKSSQLTTDVLFQLDDVKPATLLEMVARGWCKAEYVAAAKADGDVPATPATISMTLTKDGIKAIAFTVRAGRPAGTGTRTSNGPVVHGEIPVTFSKTYKDTEYHINYAGDKQITIDEIGGTFTSLTATAKAIRKMHGVEGEINGWDFFGLTK